MLAPVNPRQIDVNGWTKKCNPRMTETDLRTTHDFEVFLGARKRQPSFSVETGVIK